MKKKSNKSGLLALGGAAAALIYTAYRKDLNDAVKRVESERQFIDDGTIEFAECGNGPAVLVSHGAGGGFDQGLELGRAFAGDNYRIIAPSRFGYLGTPLPEDASPAAQADAYARVLDALEVESVPVIGVSAGGPSAIQFAIRHPERCSALVLVVPLAYAGGAKVAGAPAPKFVNAIMSWDFVAWAAMKLAFPTMCRTVLGTPVAAYRKASDVERRNVEVTMRNMLPISRRAAGLANEAAVASTLEPFPLDEIKVPTLIITTKDDGYRTYAGSRYTAEHIDNAKLVVFDEGGHLLAGHGPEVQSLIGNFLKEHPALKLAAANS